MPRYWMIILIGMLLVTISGAKPSEFGPEIPVCIADGNQGFPVSVTNGDSGYFVVWQDKRQSSLDIYAQHINSNGESLWNSGGISVCQNPGRQEYPLAVEDGQGGIFVVWQDMQSRDRYFHLQHLTAKGHRKWANSGVPLLKTSPMQVKAWLLRDKTGNLYLAWKEIFKTQTRFFLNRINTETGTLAWKKPIQISSTPRSNGDPKFIMDYPDQIILLYQIKGVEENSIYIQKISPTGQRKWGPYGIKVADTLMDTSSLSAVPDGTGGVIVVWDNPTDYYYGVYAQRFNTDGMTLWGNNPILAGTEQEGLFFPTATSDGQGGVLVLWNIIRPSQKECGLGIQAINRDGSYKWNKKSIEAVNLKGDRITDSLLTPDGSGGAIIVWSDDRRGNFDLYQQHISLTGKLIYPLNGSPLVIEASQQIYPNIMSRPNGTGLLYWWDFRRQQYDIFARILNTD